MRGEAQGLEGFVSERQQPHLLFRKWDCTVLEELGNFLGLIEMCGRNSAVQRGTNS